MGGNENMADMTFREQLPDYRNQYYRLKSKELGKRRIAQV